MPILLELALTRDFLHLPRVIHRFLNPDLVFPTNNHVKLFGSSVAGDVGIPFTLYLGPETRRRGRSLGRKNCWTSRSRSNAKPWPPVTRMPGGG
jgi:hypothetical protein